MTNRTKSAVWHPLAFRVALEENFYLYGFLGASAYGAIYLPKLFNKYITGLVGRGAMGIASPNSLVKLRNLVAQVALSALWLWV